MTTVNTEKDKASVPTRSVECSELLATEGENNPYNSSKWGVHVLGPDNVLAAHSFQEAVEKCHEINQMLINFVLNTKHCREYSPRVFAQVAVWEDITTSEHDPDKTDWANACS